MPSPGLRLAGPVHDQRGLLIGGPQCVSFSDVLVKAAEQAALSVSIYAAHFKPNLVEERRAYRLNNGRRLFSRKEAQRQREEPKELWFG